MKLLNVRRLIVSCGLFCIIIAGCVSDHGVARDYYATGVYEDFKTISNLAEEHKTVKKESKRAEEIKAKAEWTLQDCISLAIVNEEQLKIQGETYYQTKWLYYEALASWLPSISVQGQRSKYNKTIPGSFDNKNQYWLDVRQPLFNGGNEYIGLANSEELSKLRKYELKQYRDVLILGVATAFYRMLELKSELDVLESLQEYTKNYYEMVKAREEAQVARHKDTLLAEATLLDIQARIVRTKNFYNNARLDLQLLVNEPLPEKFVDTVSVAEIPKDIPTVMAMAFENRTDIKAAEQQIKVAGAYVDLAKASYLPQVNLDWTRYLHMDTDSFDQIDWSLMLNVILPIDNGGRYATVQEKYSEMRQSELAKQKLVKTVRNDAEKAYRDLQAIQSDIEAREKELAAAKETADIVIEEYKVGAATNIEVLFTKNSYEEAKLALNSSKTDLKLSYLRLKFTMGLLAREF